MTRGLRTTIRNLEERLYTLESNKPTPQVILTPPPQLPPLPQQYTLQQYPQPQPPSYYYTQQFPVPSAPRTSSVI